MRVLTAVVIISLIFIVSGLPRIRYGAKNCGSFICPKTWIPRNPYVQIRTRPSKRPPKRNQAIFDLDKIMQNRYRYIGYEIVVTVQKLSLDNLKNRLNLEFSCNTCPVIINQQVWSDCIKKWCNRVCYVNRCIY